MQLYELDEGFGYC